MPLPAIGLAIGAVLRAAPIAGPALARYAPRMANWLHIDAGTGGANTVAAVDTAHEAANLAKEVGGLASDVAKIATGGQRDSGPGPADEKGVRIAAVMEDRDRTGKGIER